jgi:hypothetical protein
MCWEAGVKRAWILIVMIGVCGCGRSSGGDAAATTAPTTTTAPATAPDGDGSLTLGEETFVFPPSRLVVQTRQDGTEAVLTSQSEPATTTTTTRQAVKQNTVFLRLLLDLPAGDSISGATADFKATSRERVDALEGINLALRQWVLQPYDMHMEIIGDRSPALVRISGAFLLFDDTTEPDIPQEVQIKAELPAELVVKPPAVGVQ